MKIRRILSALLCVFILLLSMGSCASKSDVKEPQTQARSFYEYFDTVSVIFSYKGDTQSEFEKNCAEVENILKEYHQLFDIYYEYADINNLKTINGGLYEKSFNKSGLFDARRIDGVFRRGL